jgi:DNA-binding beta-propeller fold protein YncE
LSPDGSQLAISDRTGNCIVIADAERGGILREVATRGRAAGLAWCAGPGTLLGAEIDSATVAEIDPRTGRCLRRIPVAPRPQSVAVAPRQALLVVAHAVPDVVSVIELATGRERSRIPIPRQAGCVAITPDESMAVIGGFLPAGRADASDMAIAVTLIQLDGRQPPQHIQLPPGSCVGRGVAVSPDGRWAYLVHTVGRFNLPTSQIERGWISTSALTLIDLARRERTATVLLDSIVGGAADPWGVAISPDGATLWVSLSGVHQVARVDLAGLHLLLEGRFAERPWLLKGGRPAPGTTGVWQDIHDDPRRRDRLVDEPGALDVARLIRRIALPGQGPRGVSLSRDGRRLDVAMYFSGGVARVDGDAGAGRKLLVLPPAPGQPPGRDVVREGEVAFHDATLSLQHWISCASCHPDGRADGFNWDLLNDDINNPKNTKSLLWADRTPPSMSLGIRANMEVAVAAGFRHILFRDSDARAIATAQAYLRSLEPEPSPFRPADGPAAESVERGRALFLSSATRCAECHPPPLFTDLRSYNVGTAGAAEATRAFDTPTLVELWRTGPYLHSGAAATLRDVLTTFNPGDRHGVTSTLSGRQIDELVDYLLSQ